MSVRMVVAMIMWLAMCVAALTLSAYRIAKLLDSCLKLVLGSLRCIILDRNRLVVKTYMKVLHAFLERDILLNLLHAVLAVEVYVEGNFLELFLLLCRLLVCKG